MHTQYLHLHTRALPHPPRIQEESDDQRDRQSNDLSKEAKAKAMRVRHNNTGPRAVFFIFFSAAGEVLRSQLDTVLLAAFIIRNLQMIYQNKQQPPCTRG